ncbi:MAG: hypothetical protein LBS84_12875 [Clostridiales bacterium]|jgi:hypothetical protein|nr:hypothetical protein [Clostridiales bacterium]
MAGNPRGSVRKLRELALTLEITGDTNEQTLLLAIIDVLDELVDALAESNEFPELFDGQEETGILISKCPNCGEPISLDLSNPQSSEPVVCASCHEVIGVITASMRI